MRETRMVSVSGILGYGYPEAALQAALARGVDMLGCDGGSSDPGPYYLGSGKPFVSLRAMKRDLRLMLRAAVAHRLPMLIGTCGGAGGEPHLQLVAQMVRDIAREEGLHFPMALIHSEQPKARVQEGLREGRVHPLGRMPPLAEETIERATRIVGLCGPEPYMRALDEGAQVVLGGRSSDPAPFAAHALRAQLPPAQAWYAGKMLECGAAPALPKGPDCLLVTVREDGVVCEPMGERACTPLSVANHSLHENASPIRHVEPGGVLDTSECRFEAVSPKATLVTGMRWHPAGTYTVKLEAAERLGHRAVSFAGTRDPGLIGQLPGFLDRVRSLVAEKARDLEIGPEAYRLTIHRYGLDGVMGAREPLRGAPGHEIGFLIDVVGEDAEIAAAVIALARTSMLHCDFPGRLCKEGNMAIPFSPSDLMAGEVYRFSMAHVMETADPCALFPIEHERV
ncbi:acyclic terpene utilization AtuA family protein [Roseicella sp. DB1501]|uniref:acyclic terpene utilization AtuA family protein n=1 Tax=Roseicella sp. DB1501 TaxID=2730925 RepID=UPI0020C3CB93|nr:acyclic terpene utilization AtuA family protein [Roseicella sp. DB1501]